MDGAVGDGALSPEMAAVQASLLALLGAARGTLDAIEALVAEPRTFAAGAQLVQETAALAVPLVRALAASLLTPPSETGR